MIVQVFAYSVMYPTWKDGVTSLYFDVLWFTLFRRFGHPIRHLSLRLWRVQVDNELPYFLSLPLPLLLLSLPPFWFLSAKGRELMAFAIPTLIGTWADDFAFFLPPGGVRCFLGRHKDAWFFKRTECQCGWESEIWHTIVSLRSFLETLWTIAMRFFVSELDAPPIRKHGKPFPLLPLTLFLCKLYQNDKDVGVLA